MNPRSNPRAAGQNGEIQKCQEAIGYLFRREGLLRKALTHSSVKDEKHPSNERLEFLGDAILGMAISEYLFSLLPGNDEGDLTKIKSVVVSGEALARLGFELGIDKHLLIGKGLRMKGELPRSLIANAVEAIIAAVYLDRGMEAARHFVLDHLHGYVEEVLHDDHTEKNYKSLLQQRAQREFSATPVYRVLGERGPDHSKLFRVTAVLKNREYPVGTGASKKEAEQDAARSALKALEKEGLRPRRGGGRSARDAEPARNRGGGSRSAPPPTQTEPPAQTERSRGRRGSRRPEPAAPAEVVSRSVEEEKPAAPPRRRSSRKSAAKRVAPAAPERREAEAAPEPGRSPARSRKRRAPAKTAAPVKEKAREVAPTKPARRRSTAETESKPARPPSRTRKRKAPAKKAAAQSESREPERTSESKPARAPARSRKRKAPAKKSAPTPEKTAETREKRRPRRRRTPPSSSSD